MTAGARECSAVLIAPAVHHQAPDHKTLGKPEENLTRANVKIFSGTICKPDG
jgi:hypothetical protein